MNLAVTMKDGLPYEEKVTSNKTRALFLALMLLFLSLLAWRLVAGPGALAVAFFCLFAAFLFYSLNYRALVIRIDRGSLRLGFGVFTWTVPMDNIAACRLDDLTWLQRMGGAGIHFMKVRRRYRVSFNFLEHPRLVIELKKKAGLVRDVSFSTRRPDEIVRLIRHYMEAEAGRRRPGPGEPGTDCKDANIGAVVERS
jgi:hypothetical protein